MFDAPEVDSNTTEFLMATAGGSVAGIIVYKSVYKALADKTTFTPIERQVIAITAGTTTALLIGYGLAKLIKAFK